MPDDLLDVLRTGGLPAVLAASLIALWMVLRHLRSKPPPPPLAVVIPEPEPARRGPAPLRRVLVVDEEPAAGRALAKALGASLEGAEVATAGSVEEALEVARSAPFNAVVVGAPDEAVRLAELVRAILRARP